MSNECSDWFRDEEPNCKLWDKEPKGDVTGGDKLCKPRSCTSPLQGIFTGAEAPNKPIKNKRKNNKKIKNKRKNNKNIIRQKIQETQSKILRE